MNQTINYSQLFNSELTGSDSLSTAVKKTALANSSRSKDKRLLKFNKIWLKQYRKSKKQINYSMDCLLVCTLCGLVKKEILWPQHTYTARNLEVI